MRLLHIDHVQITVPKDREQEARHFYGKVLGLQELERPSTIPAPGLWYAFAEGTQLHIILAENPFKPPLSDHFAVVADEMDVVNARLAEHHIPYQPSPVQEGFDRIFIKDPFGNHLEVMAPA